MTVLKCIIDMLETRTIEAQIVQKKPKNNEARPKFTGSYKREKCAVSLINEILSQFVFRYLM